MKYYLHIEGDQADNVHPVTEAQALKIFRQSRIDAILKEFEVSDEKSVVVDGVRVKPNVEFFRRLPNVGTNTLLGVGIQEALTAVQNKAEALQIISDLQAQYKTSSNDLLVTLGFDLARYYPHLKK